MTVCEVLARRIELNGKVVAVVGAYDPGGFPDGGPGLVESRCSTPVMTKAKLGESGEMLTTEWPPRIALQNLNAGTQDLVVDNKEDLAKKLKILQGSTSRGCYTASSLDSITGQTVWRNYQFQWGVAYGILTTRADLHGRQGRPELPGFSSQNGYGPQNESPASLSIGEFKIHLVGTRNPCPDTFR
jgi:hypothetical protein